MVVLVHVWMVLPSLNGVLMIGGYDMSWLLRSHGGAGVWMFFVLSGYLMGKAFASNRYPVTWQGVLAFLQNRAVRIVPLYYLTVISFVLLLTHPWQFLATADTLRLASFTKFPLLAVVHLDRGAVLSVRTGACAVDILADPQ